MRVRYSPLGQQFAHVDSVFEELRALVASGDFTLGKPVREFEAMFASAIGVKHAIGVGSGTDAIKIPLRALGIGPGDEVITAANTFYATVGAICEVGAKPVFVDCVNTFCIDVIQLEQAITPSTKALVPVHLTGDVAEMPRIVDIAKRHNLAVIEDGCQSLLANMRAGASAPGRCHGVFDASSEDLNVWGDAGIVVTNDDEMNAACACCAIMAYAIATKWKSLVTTRVSTLRRPWSANGSCVSFPISWKSASRTRHISTLDFARSRKFVYRRAAPKRKTSTCSMSFSRGSVTTYSSTASIEASRPRCTIRSPCIFRMH